jgi:ABC-type sugar transport system ATPase subunit
VDTILSMERIVKAFPGVRAVNDVSFDLQRGEIHALLGHNGAGKSTLVKIISGAYQRDSGEIYLNGEPVNFTDPGQAISAGIHMVYQELDLIPFLSGSENIYLGQKRFHTRLGFIDHRKKLRAAQEIVKRLDVERIELGSPVGELSVSKQQVIAIAKAISANAKIIIFDEPTSALNDSETRKLFDIMRLLTKEGVALILITHRLDEVFDIADRVTVMRDGKHIFTRPVEEVTKQEIINNMTDVVGAPERMDERGTPELGQTVLSVQDIGDSNAFHNVSFDLHKGEVLGLTGLIGCGAIEVARAIYGASQRDTGAVKVNNEFVKKGNTEDAARKRLAFVSDDRKRDGLVVVGSVRSNISLTILDQLSRFGVVIPKKENEGVRQMVDKLRIRISSPDQLAGTLSGGNQQKVVLSKWLLKDSEVLLLCEPTRGIDVATKREIHHMIRDFAANGMGVLVVSSEIDEILDTCDRVLVLYEGRIIGEVTNHDFDRAKIINWMYGEN